MTRTKEQLKADLKLDELPDDEFMALLNEVGDGETVALPPEAAQGRTWVLEEIENAVIVGTVGRLLERARAASGQSLRAAGKSIRRTHSRVRQIEESENVEIATLVRLAHAYGYEVDITLRPVTASGDAISAVLAASNTDPA